MIESFVQSVEENFKLMLECTARPVDVAERPPSDRPRPRDISAVMGFTGGFQGIVILCFPHHVATQIVERCTGEASATDEETVDAVTEFLNMIAGHAKRSLRAVGNLIEMSLPTVVIGPNHEAFHPSDHPCMRIDFESDLGEFFIQLSLQKSTQTTRILIADDSRLSRRIMRGAITGLADDVEFIECSDGLSTRSTLDDVGYHVDLLVLDIRMPKLSGLEVFKALRLIPEGRNVPVLFITSDQNAEAKLEEVQKDLSNGLGLCHLMFKPFRAEKVREEAQKLLEARDAIKAGG